MKKPKPGTNARDLVLYWARRYRETVGRNYFIRWMPDGSVFKRLLSTHKAPVIKRVIDFAFSGDDHTIWFKNQGYSINLLPSVFNQFLSVCEKPWISIDRYELETDTHYSADMRTEFIWSSIVEGNIEALICHITDEYYFHLLLAKIEAIDGSIPKKVMLFYEMWKNKEPLERTRIYRAKKD